MTLHPSKGVIMRLPLCRRVSITAAAFFLAMEAHVAAHAASPALSTMSSAMTSSAMTSSAMKRQQQNYQVEVQNFSDQPFDEIVLAFTRQSNPVAELLHQPNVQPFSVVSFDLGPCADVKQYAVSGIVGGVRVITTGDVDADPVGCSDIVTFQNRSAAISKAPR